ncbi:MAG: hypothetical protein APF81_26725 [Desulfosporosinus sp. BRH_c37]|nr:MAG: hypothetical protein APF81_26725 [Desulfosporosinus sp. BRH_c37]
MKEEAKYFLGLWLVVTIGLIWLQGGGRYSYGANKGISLLFTMLVSLVITISIRIYFYIKK